MIKLNGLSFAAVTFLLAAGSVAPAVAAEPPADLCALLPAALVSKTLRETFDTPQKSEAPRPFANTATGTDCKYQTQSQKYSLVFIAYVDPSASASADLFARLKSWFGMGSTAVTGVGDEAYMDKSHGLHVRKGKVRYFLSGSATDAQLKDLASYVAGQL